MLEEKFGQIASGIDVPAGHHADYAINGIVPSRGLVFVLGAPKTGKSLFIMWLAACLATGRRVFDCTESQLDAYGSGFAEPVLRGSTLYLVAEDGDIAHKRVAGISAYFNTHLIGESLPLPNDTLPITRLPVAGLEVGDLLHVQNISKKELAKHEETGLPIKLVVFDTLAAAFALRDENDNAKMQDIIRELRAYAKAFDALVVVVTHPKKSGRRRVETIRGASSIDASADVILQISKYNQKNKPHLREIRISKVRDGACEGEKFLFEIDTYDGQPALHPTSNLEDVTTNRSSPILRQEHLDVLQLLEQLSNECCDEVSIEDPTTEIPIVSATSLVQRILQNSEAISENSDVGTSSLKQRKDATRKKLERTMTLLEANGLVVKHQVTRKTYYRPYCDWDTLTNMVATLAPNLSYQSLATCQREKINQMFYDASRDDDAMSKSSFLAFTRIGTKISSLDKSAP